MRNLKYDCYLAGAMAKRLGKDVLDERENAKSICRQLGLRYYDPAEDELIHPRRIIDAKPSLSRMKKFVVKDFRNLDKCKAVVALTGDKASSGTLWECARMKFIHKRPVILVAPQMYDGQLANFSTVLADKVCATPLQAFKYLKRSL